MTSVQLYIILFTVKHIKKSICNLFIKTNKELDYAKSIRLNNSELDTFFDNYRKDKFLKQCYIKNINNLIKYVERYLKYNMMDDYDKFINYLSHVIDFHKTTTYVNKDGESNAITHFSPKGIFLVNSFDLTRLNIIYTELNTKYFIN
jgi:hypothetical protein